MMANMWSAFNKSQIEQSQQQLAAIPIAIINTISNLKLH